MTARIIDVSPDDYHKRPGLSASIATTIITRSPLHAWADHPMLGGKDAESEDDSTKEMDFGSVVHTLVLGKGKRFTVCDFKDWKTKAAQEEREAARESGSVPILAHNFQRASVASAAIVSQLADRDIYLDGQSEVAVEWEEDSIFGPVLCRCMMDHVWLDTGVILDLKTTTDASRRAVERSADRFGYAIQAAAYRRALVRLRPEHAGRTEFLFAFGETYRPHVLNVCRPDGWFREVGEERWAEAVATWAKCLAEDKWPAYGTGINAITVPPWVAKAADETDTEAA